MAARSLVATPQGVELIDRAMTNKQWSREDLSSACECSRQPSVKFCSGKKVSKKLFVCFCEALELDWEAVSGIKRVQEVTEADQTDIDSLVKAIRLKVSADIHHRCGTMRVLDMEQPIDIGEVYTHVNVLEKLSGRQRVGIKELWQNCDTSNFDRLMLGQVSVERVPGLEAVGRYNKLMILGKPGAGKTTFMKRLATQCNQGKFEADRIPVFITLKEFAEDEGKPDLKNYLAQQWRACDVEETHLTRVLKLGHVLVLLDGLDEIQAIDQDRVLKSIKTFTEQFYNCQCVMTCRIAAREYMFEKFTDVEVADFNEEQIKDFAAKWFRAKNNSEKSKNFIKRLQNNKPIKELATNPLLLTLLCLVFDQLDNFPNNRSDLCKEGLDALLKQWDAKRNIRRDQVYKKLSLKQKVDLLSQLAYQTFDQGNYFFKQNVIETKIKDYISSLTDEHEDEEVLQLDSEAVLNSIEAQHGLLVERAKGIYSFSHLIFQEYFTAQHITSSSVQNRMALENLAQQCTNKRYREVIFLAAEILDKADNFLKILKSKVDQIIANESILQDFMVWVYEKSESVEVRYQKSAIRAFYLNLSLNLNLDIGIHLPLDLSISHALGLYEINISQGDLSHALPHILALDFDLLRILYRGLVLTLDPKLFRVEEFSRSLSFLLELTEENSLELNSNIKELKPCMPNIECTNNFENINDLIIFLTWWQENGCSWIKNLRRLMNEYQNIGHNLQLSNNQKTKLRQYWDANKLLIECLNSECDITQSVRQEIESTLLLPISKLQE